MIVKLLLYSYFLYVKLTPFALLSWLFLLAFGPVLLSTHAPDKLLPLVSYCRVAKTYSQRFSHGSQLCLLLLVDYLLKFHLYQILSRSTIDNQNNHVPIQHPFFLNHLHLDQLHLDQKICLIHIMVQTQLATPGDWNLND